MDEIKKAMKGRPLKVSAICAGFEGWLIARDPKIRKQCMDSMKEILTAAGELGSVGMIMVPSFNRQDEQGSLPPKDARILMVPYTWWTERKEDGPKMLLQELGDHAVKAGTTVILEPLNRKECYFLRQLADAAAICRDANNPGVAMMGDFWHMTWEETCDMGAFLSAGGPSQARAHRQSAHPQDARRGRRGRQLRQGIQGPQDDRLPELHQL